MKKTTLRNAMLWSGVMALAGFFTLVSAPLIGQQALAGKPAPGQGPGNHLRILEVHTDATDGTLTISGESFDFGPGPLTVSLGTLGDITPLCEVPELEPNTIVCTFTGDNTVDSGDYLLTVARGSGQSQGDEYDLTIAEALNPGDPGPN